MLLDLFAWLEQYDSGFQVFRYLTVRGTASLLTALLIGMLVGPYFIRRLQTHGIGETIRDEYLSAHVPKTGTPTMGGVLILFSLLASVALWGSWSNVYLWVLVGTTILYAAIGAFDDIWKLRSKQGIRAGTKFILQILAGAVIAGTLYASASSPEQTTFYVPVFKELHFALGLWFIPLATFMLVLMSNAVNLTDGLDGLAMMPAVLIFGGLGVFAYASGHSEMSAYLDIAHIKHAGEVVIYCAALIGAGLGFLWFNAYPAQVFMGDVGALAIGAALGAIAVILRQEIILLVMAGVFLVEVLSVVLQVASFQMTGKRIFAMAPLHHHFELKGWPEPRIAVRFWIITLILVLIGLSTLKIR